MKLGKLAVRVIRPGEGWGRFEENTAKYALFEFRDARITERDPKGHVVARIAAKVIFCEEANQGISLDERVPAWSLTSDQVSEVRQYYRDGGQNVAR